MKRLHLHIDRVVVEGLPAHSGKRFGRALEAQLTKLASSGLAQAAGRGQGARIASLDAGVLRPGATPEQAAAQITAALGTRLAGGLAGKEARRHA